MKLGYELDHYVGEELGREVHNFIFRLDTTYAISHYVWYDEQIEELVDKIRKTLSETPAEFWTCDRHFETLFVCVDTAANAMLFKLAFG